MSPLQSILAKYRASSQSEREKGSYFEQLIRANIILGFNSADRGKLIMACGTGKTLALELRHFNPLHSNAHRI